MLSLAVLATLMAVGTAYDPAEDSGPVGYETAYESQSGHSGMGSDYMASRAHGDDGRNDGRHDGRHDEKRDWLPTGTGHTFYKYPKYNYNWYYPAYTYPTYTYTYPTYTYTYPTYYYTTPVYSSWYYEPVTYDPWWATNVYGMSSKTYYYGSWSWSSTHGGYYW